jgi:HK97 family phage major capsid protein
MKALALCGVAAAALSIPARPRAIAGAVRADGDPMALIGQIKTAFEEFKAQNDARLKQIEGRGEDPITAEQVERINTTLGDLQAAYEEQQKKIAAGVLQPGERKLVDAEYSKQWDEFVRGGIESDRVRASLDKSSSAAGGYLAPTEWDRTITDKLVKVSPMRAICQVQSISTAAFSKLFNLRGMASGWVGDQAARPATGTPTFGSLSYTPGELYANPAASQGMLDDAQIDLEQLIGDDIATEFARAEGAAFISGDGTNKPAGILTYVTGAANAAAHPFGAILVRAATGTVNKLDKADDIVSFVHDLPSEKTANARFLMNRNTLAAVRLLKDSQNRYLWQPSYQAGQPQTLQGYPITEAADMPDIATGAIPLLFGDFAAAYLIVDRTGVRMLRDPYTNKPYVQFYTTKRVGGGLLNPEAMKALKIN